jgi:hypothetical protein
MNAMCDWFRPAHVIVHFWPGTGQYMKAMCDWFRPAHVIVHFWPETG